jgi:CRP-like cAMP-binding protein
MRAPSALGLSPKKKEKRRNSLFDFKDASQIPLGVKLFSVEKGNKKYEIMRPWIMHPDSIFVQFWNVAMAICILFAVIYVPFTLSFGYQPKLANGGIEAACECMQILMDLYFFLDIFVEFRIAIVVEGELVQNTSTIASSYLRSWFTLDFLSTFGSLIGKLLPQIAILSNARVVKLMRILKLMRMAKLKQIMEAIEEMGVGHEMKVAGKLIQLSMLTLIITHLVGCGFYALAFYVNEEEMNWIVAYTDMDDWNTQMSIGSKYLQSLYWAYVTVTTVGYGDILPVTDVEKLYTICITFLGTAVFAYINGEVAALASNKNREAQEYEAKRSEVEEFVTHFHIPPHLRVKIKRYYQSAKETGAFVKQDQILSELPANLRREVINALQSATLSQMPVFQHMPPAVAQKILFLFEPVQLGEGDVLFASGQQCKEIYLLQRGEVELQKKGSRSVLLGAGSSFGMIRQSEGNNITEKTANGSAENYTVSAVASTACSLMRVDEAYIKEIGQLWPAFEQLGGSANLRLVRRSVDMGAAGDSLAFAQKLRAKVVVKQKMSGMKSLLKQGATVQTVDGKEGRRSRRWVEGRQVRVTKECAFKGEEGLLVADLPVDWTKESPLEVKMTNDGETRSFPIYELELVQEVEAGESSDDDEGARAPTDDLFGTSIDNLTHPDSTHHQHDRWMNLLHKHTNSRDHQDRHQKHKHTESAEAIRGLEGKIEVLQTKLEEESKKNEAFREAVLAALATKSKANGAVLA